MKTIEERAKEYSYKIHYGNSPLDNHLRGRERTIYLDAAKEQRKIDIDKAWRWIENNTLFPTGTYGIDIWEYVFRKEMEE